MNSTLKDIYNEVWFRLHQVTSCLLCFTRQPFERRSLLKEITAQGPVVLSIIRLTKLLTVLMFLFTDIFAEKM